MPGAVLPSVVVMDASIGLIDGRGVRIAIGKLFQGVAQRMIARVLMI